MKKIAITKEKNSLVFILILLMAGFIYMMRPFLMPVILATIFVILFSPVYTYLITQGRLGAKLSALLTTFLVFFVLILPSALVATILIDQTYAFIGTLNLKETFAQLFTNNIYVLYVEPYLQEFEQRFQIQVDVFGLLTQLGKQIAKTVYGFSPQVLLGTATFIFDFFLMMVSVYFLFLEGPRLLKVAFDLSPLRETHERRLTRKIKDTIDASVHGYLLTALIQGAIATVIFAIVGLPTYMVLGTLTFFMSMVPIVGAAGVWIPVCVWFLLQGQTASFFIVLAGGAGLISAIDNFIKPIIIQGKTKIHPLLIFFSLLGGITLFGPLGILFGPVVTALLIASINIYREEFI